MGSQRVGHDLVTEQRLEENDLCPPGMELVRVEGLGQPQATLKDPCLRCLKEMELMDDH